MLINLVDKDAYYRLYRYIVTRDDSLSFTKSIDDDKDVTVVYTVNILTG